MYCFAPFSMGPFKHQPSGDRQPENGIQGLLAALCNRLGALGRKLPSNFCELRIR
jgi:hypothetical protein